MSCPIPDHWTPWIGPAYDQRRLLILGESFYLLEDERGVLSPPAKDQPVKLVTDAFEGDAYRYRFNRMIVRALAGREELAEDDWRTAWNDVAFTNYVTTVVDGRARARPDGEAWALAARAWPSLLACLRPRAIVVLGKAIWNNMPPEGYDATDETYRVPNGERAFCISLRHPAAGLSWHALSDAIAEVEGRAGA